MISSDSWHKRLSYLRSLKERKEEVSRLLLRWTKLTPAIQQQLQAAYTTRSGKTSIGRQAQRRTRHCYRE